MNILQLAQTMGSFKIGDFDNASILIKLITSALPDNLYVDTITTGEQIVLMYQEMEIEYKKKLISVDLYQVPRLVENILGDLYYLTQQTNAIREREERARNFQFIGMVLFVCLSAGYFTYGYYLKANELLGENYKSPMTEFFNTVGETSKKALEIIGENGEGQ